MACTGAGLASFHEWNIYRPRPVMPAVIRLKPPKPSESTLDAFEQVWESSRTNAFSWGYTASLWGGLVVLVGLCLIRNKVLRRAGNVLAVLEFAALATEWSARGIFEKWRLRREWAETNSSQMIPDGWDALAADGANLTLGPLIYGFQAFLMFCIAAFVLSLLRSAIVSRKTPAKVGEEPIPDVVDTAELKLPETKNPYQPPATKTGG